MQQLGASIKMSILQVIWVCVAGWAACSAFSVLVVLPLMYKVNDDHFDNSCSSDTEMLKIAIALGPIMMPMMIVAIVYKSTIGLLSVDGSSFYNKIETFYRNLICRL